MAYIYNSQDDRLDFPNPYRIENLFYGAAALLLGIGGIGMLFSARHLLADGGRAAPSLLVGLGLLILGLRYAAHAMTQLRFFFGRGYPAGLATELATDQIGTSAGARHLQELIRHNSLSFNEPTGPLNGVLYSLLRNLIYAPQELQAYAQRQFHNSIAIAALLLSLAVSSMGASAICQGWLGLLYFAGMVIVILQPLQDERRPTADFGLRTVIVLVAVAILGPVLIAQVAHDVAAPAWSPSLWQDALLMLLAEGAMGLFFLAVIAQTLKEPPQASMAVIQDTLSMNGHPRQVSDELERHLQTGWTASLPNRRYARTLPEVALNTGSGSFTGELLEETQPMPSQSLKGLTLSGCFEEARYRWLAGFNVYGLMLTVSGMASLIWFTQGVQDAASQGVEVRLAALGLSLCLLGHFCFSAGSRLWSRFDFKSRLIWVEMAGNYQAAQMDYGSPLLDRIKTQRDVINIETMTLRTWVVELDTVTFGKGAQRNILGMRGQKEEAEHLHQHLSQFGQQQTLLVAPTSAHDLQRASVLDAMNQRGEAPTLELLRQALQPVGGPPATASATTPAPVVTCCDRARRQGSRFCPDCGKPLASV